ncbi:hypothetical protein FACS1894188_11410 [Clostridia bacterium]|nr:hypothetical protein FACS1894188_11410 [Clostridia bacterium]
MVNDLETDEGFMKFIDERVPKNNDILNDGRDFINAIYEYGEALSALHRGNKPLNSKIEPLSDYEFQQLLSRI